MTIKKGVEDERNDGRGRWSAQGLASTLRWAVLGLLAFAACNGDGCDGCGGCDGGCDSGGCAGTPYPANAPSVTRGAQVRLTPQAFDFLEGAVEPLLGDLLGDTGTTFCVPEGSNPTLCNARTCPSTGETGCELSLSIDDVQIEAIEPNRVQASVVLGGLNQETDFLELDLATAVSCILRLGTVNDAGIPASINASFSVDPATRDVKLNLNPSDIQIDFNALDIDIDPVSILDFLACEGIDLVLGLDFLRDAIFDGIAGPLGEGISAATSGLLCVGCTSTTDCPSGSECLTDPTDEERSLCYVGGDTAQCVARPLGFEDVIDIGQLLSGTIPGLEAELAFQIKAHDYADVVEDGFSLGMKLGAYADKAACVPPAPVPTPLEVPRSVLLQGNLGPTGQPFHLGLGLSKAGLDEALWGVYNSGTLCLSAGSSLSDLLSTQTIGLLMPSLRDLTGPSVAPVYLQLVPSKPPTAIIGAGTIDPDSGEIIDPLLTLEVKDLSIDFYAFAHERYVRVMRITSDLRVPLGLNPTEEGLLIVLGDLTQAFQNVRVSESELLKETPDSLAGLIPQLVGIALPLLGDSLFSPIEIPEFQGFTLDLENSVLQGIENNSMLGIFALLALAPDGQQAQAPRVETHVELLDLTLQPAHLLAPGALSSDARARLLREQAPTARFVASSLWAGAEPDPSTVEYSHRLDGGLWSTYRRSPELTLTSGFLLLQGRHTLEVRARIKGLQRTTDLTPAALAFDVDFEAPQVELVRLAGGVLRPSVMDAGSRPDELLASTRVHGGAWSGWAPLADMKLADLLGEAPAGLVELRVRDAAGHETVTSQRFALVEDPAPQSSSPQDPAPKADTCACATPAAPAKRGGWGWALLASFAAVLVGRRARASLALRATALGSLLLAWAGFGCEDDAKRGVGQEAACPGGCPTGQRCVDGVCSLGCGTEADCGAGEVCVAGECKLPDECDENADCPAGEACVEDTDGHKLCDEEPCDEADDCTIECEPTEPVCEQGVCGCAEPCAEGCAEGSVCCETRDECTPLPDPCAEAECAPGTRPLLEEAPAFDSDTCEVTPGRCGCVELDPLPLGTVGLYLDAAVAPDDQVLLSGYNSQYGDLMFGVVGQAGPAWVFVDGVPADGAVTGSVNGPRGGVAVNGPNVGRFTSLAVGSNGHIHIAYRDDANKDLKYAHGAPSAGGYTFRVQTVDAEGDAGLWADLSLGADGVPGIAYMVAEVEEGGVKRSKLRWAQAGSDDPASGAWTLADLDAVDLPTEEPEGVPDLPLGVGHFASVGRLSSGAVVVAYYDRVGTDLRLVRQEGGVWGAPVILDGRDGQGVDTGDRGRWASLVVGADDQVHVAYEDFDKADLRYLNLSAQVSELVDDGVRVLPNNGVSIRRVGAGARLLLGPDGLPRVAYQDATEHALLLARKDAQGQWSLLTVAGLEEPYKGSYGFYNGHVIVGGQSVMATFRYNRTSNPATNGVDLFRF